MKFRLVSTMLAMLILAVTALAPMSASATHNPLHNIAVTGTGTLNGVAGTFVGTLDINRFARQGDNLAAIGTLTGTFTDALGNVLPVVGALITSIITPLRHTCDILELNIGAIHLDLLGLVLDISPIDITIVAESGPGNLLGNLLCAIAGLLDNPAGPLGAIANLLNQILRVLR